MRKGSRGKTRTHMSPTTKRTITRGETKTQNRDKQRKQQLEQRTTKDRATKTNT